MTKAFRYTYVCANGQELPPREVSSVQDFLYYIVLSPTKHSYYVDACIFKIISVITEL